MPMDIDEKTAYKYSVPTAKCEKGNYAYNVAKLLSTAFTHLESINNHNEIDAKDLIQESDRINNNGARQYYVAFNGNKHSVTGKFTPLFSRSNDSINNLQGHDLENEPNNINNNIKQSPARSAKNFHVKYYGVFNLSKNGNHKRTMSADRLIGGSIEFPPKSVKRQLSLSVKKQQTDFDNNDGQVMDNNIVTKFDIDVKDTNTDYKVGRLRIQILEHTLLDVINDMFSENAKRTIRRQMLARIKRAFSKQISKDVDDLYKTATIENLNKSGIKNSSDLKQVESMPTNDNIPKGEKTDEIVLKNQLNSSCDCVITRTNIFNKIQPDMRKLTLHPILTEICSAYIDEMIMWTLVDRGKYYKLKNMENNIIINSSKTITTLLYIFLFESLLELAITLCLDINQVKNARTFSDIPSPFSSIQQGFFQTKIFELTRATAVNWILNSVLSNMGDKMSIMNYDENERTDSAQSILSLLNQLRKLNSKVLSQDSLVNFLSQNKFSEQDNIFSDCSLWNSCESYKKSQEDLSDPNNALDYSSLPNPNYGSAPNSITTHLHGSDNSSGQQWPEYDAAEHNSQGITNSIEVSVNGDHFNHSTSVLSRLAHVQAMSLHSSVSPHEAKRSSAETPNIPGNIQASEKSLFDFGWARDQSLLECQDSHANYDQQIIYKNNITKNEANNTSPFNNRGQYNKSKSSENGKMSSILISIPVQKKQEALSTNVVNETHNHLKQEPLSLSTNWNILQRYSVTGAKLPVCKGKPERKTCDSKFVTPLSSYPMTNECLNVIKIKSAAEMYNCPNQSDEMPIQPLKKATHTNVSTVLHQSSDESMNDFTPINVKSYKEHTPASFEGKSSVDSTWFQMCHKESNNNFQEPTSIPDQNTNASGKCDIQVDIDHEKAIPVVPQFISITDCHNKNTSTVHQPDGFSDHTFTSILDDAINSMVNIMQETIINPINTHNKSIIQTDMSTDKIDFNQPLDKHNNITVSRTDQNNYDTNQNHSKYGKLSSKIIGKKRNILMDTKNKTKYQVRLHLDTHKDDTQTCVTSMSEYSDRIENIDTEQSKQSNCRSTFDKLQSTRCQTSAFDTNLSIDGSDLCETLSSMNLTSGRRSTSKLDPVKTNNLQNSPIESLPHNLTSIKMVSVCSGECRKIKSMKAPSSMKRSASRISNRNASISPRDNQSMMKVYETKSEKSESTSFGMTKCRKNKENITLNKDKMKKTKVNSVAHKKTSHKHQSLNTSKEECTWKDINTDKSLDKATDAFVDHPSESMNSVKEKSISNGSKTNLKLCFDTSAQILDDDTPRRDSSKFKDSECTDDSVMQRLIENIRKNLMTELLPSLHQSLNTLSTNNDNETDIESCSFNNTKLCSKIPKLTKKTKKHTLQHTNKSSPTVNRSSDINVTNDDEEKLKTSQVPATLCARNVNEITIKNPLETNDKRQEHEMIIPSGQKKMNNASIYVGEKTNIVNEKNVNSCGSTIECRQPTLENENDAKVNGTNITTPFPDVEQTHSPLKTNTPVFEDQAIESISAPQPSPHEDKESKDSFKLSTITPLITKMKHPISPFEAVDTLDEMTDFMSSTSRVGPKTIKGPPTLIKSKLSFTKGYAAKSTALLKKTTGLGIIDIPPLQDYENIKRKPIRLTDANEVKFIPEMNEAEHQAELNPIVEFTIDRRKEVIVNYANDANKESLLNDANRENDPKVENGDSGEQKIVQSLTNTSGSKYCNCPKDNFPISNTRAIYESLTLCPQFSIADWTAQTSLSSTLSNDTSNSDLKFKRMSLINKQMLDKEVVKENNDLQTTDDVVTQISNRMSRNQSLSISKTTQINTTCYCMMSCWDNTCTCRNESSSSILLTSDQKSNEKLKYDMPVTQNKPPDLETAKDKFSKQKELDRKRHIQYKEAIKAVPPRFFEHTKASLGKIRSKSSLDQTKSKEVKNKFGH